jgi:hypothetical protein
VLFWREKLQTPRPQRVGAEDAREWLALGRGWATSGQWSWTEVIPTSCPRAALFFR